MADGSAIEWTDATWNPVTGCTKVSPGCDNCYAERFAERWRGVAGHPYEQGFDLVIHPDRIAIPLRWVRPRMIFVNSMSDLFHRRIGHSVVLKIYGVMATTPRHTYQVLTKRSSRMRRFVDSQFGHHEFRGDHRPLGTAPANIWHGVSVESAEHAVRIRHLRETRSAVRFLSLEPLLGPLPDLDLDGIHWVIAGGESGPGFRAPRVEWLRDIRDQCEAAGVPFFFKQWGGPRPKAGGRSLDGRTHDGMPEVTG